MTMLETKPAELAHTFTADTCFVGTPAMPACADCTSLGSETSTRSGLCLGTIDSPLLSPSMCIVRLVQSFDDTSSMPVRLQTAPPGPVPPSTVPSDIASQSSDEASDSSRNTCLPSVAIPTMTLPLAASDPSVPATNGDVTSRADGPTEVRLFPTVAATRLLGTSSQAVSYTHLRA